MFPWNVALGIGLVISASRSVRSKRLPVGTFDSDDIGLGHLGPGLTTSKSSGPCRSTRLKVALLPLWRHQTRQRRTSRTYTSGEGVTRSTDNRQPYADCTVDMWRVAL